MKNIYQFVQNYIPYNEQEEKDKALILQQLSAENILTRKNHLAHLTVSAWIVSPDYQKVLMAYHNIYQSYAWLGGHLDGNADIVSVIKKEIQEESGLSEFQLMENQLFSLEVLTVDGHVKNGEYVSSHLHLNLTFLCIANPDLPIHIRPSENSQIAWLEVDKINQSVSEVWFMKHIYQKLIDKVKLLEGESSCASNN
ncbi:NUDIX hydrolase [uncultured Enterococcus sp.]|uniref:NUDIX hydrolase n=1 Tax=uncultured Enterococcus sp. TaxID=167972 RepID=UPI00262773E3|nr:NUDIX hydrolase [uncultured Enterococcus sp.]